jgi:nicotinamidase-related amidase
MHQSSTTSTTSISAASGPVDKHGITFGPLGESWVHLCIDMQRMFGEPTDWQTPWLRVVLPKVIQLVELAPERTVFTRFVPVQTAEHAHGAWQRYYRRWPAMTLERLDSALVELVPDLTRFVPPARVFDKRVYSPWADGRLDAMLRGLGVDTVVISGAETEVCVLAAVIGAMDLGYRVIVVTDALCSSADQTHDAALEVYHNRFGMQVEVTTVAELVEARIDGLL